MRTKKLIEELNAKVERLILDGNNSVKLIELLREENISLRNQNELLFNKLMARDFESYAIYKSEEASPEVVETFDPLTDDSLAGDIVDETEQSTNTKQI